LGCKAWKLRHGLRKRLAGQLRVVLCINSGVGVAEQLRDGQQVAFNTDRMRLALARRSLAVRFSSFASRAD